jgi:hypothetical protein
MHNKEDYKRILRKRLNPYLAFSCLLIVSLYSAYAVNVKAMGLFVFAGRVSAQIPMAVCMNTTTCSACSLCGCGSWDQNIIAPIYGKTLNSSLHACRTPSYLPMGTGMFQVGSVVLGYCESPFLWAYSPVCNIWSMYSI